MHTSPDSNIILYDRFLGRIPNDTTVSHVGSENNYGTNKQLSLILQIRHGNYITINGDKLLKFHNIGTITLILPKVIKNDNGLTLITVPMFRGTRTTIDEIYFRNLRK
jgi:hypothetical protein